MAEKFIVERTKAVVENYKVFLSIYEVFKDGINTEFKAENDIEFAKALLSAQYTTDEVWPVIADKSPIAPILSNKARDYGKNIVKDAKKQLDEKKGTDSTGGKLAIGGLERRLSQEIDLDKAEVLAALLLVLGYELEKIRAIELEQFEVFEQQELFRRLEEIFRMLREEENVRKKKGIKR